jgi:hypothetical protein
MANLQSISNTDVDILRSLAERKAAAALSRENLERKSAWYLHDEGTSGRPMILAEIQGIRDENRPVAESDLQCSDPQARTIEHSMLAELYNYDVLKDDHVVEPWVNVGWDVTIGNYGVEPVVHSGDHDGKMGARRWDPPIKDLDADFGKLHTRDVSVDRDSTLARKELLEKIFAGILPVRIRGSFYWTMGLTWRAIDLIGLEGLMLAMYDNPEGLHRLMGFLRDDHLNLVSWLEREGLYALNDENDYIGSGSMGYTWDFQQLALPDAPVEAKRLWVLSESQETVGVSPELFAEFVFPYQKSIVERFGKCYYGCCEPLDGRWHVVKDMPKLARVSVSPWADEEFMADALGSRYVYSRKPAPSMISMGVFNEDEVRSDIRHTLEVARGCRIELIMKDVHTLANEPQRLTRWVKIAREEAARILA